jgi:putative transposase
MTRPPRFLVPGVPVHVIHRGNNRESIFLASDDRRAFADILLDACRFHGVAIHGYVLMDNHFHLLATPERAVSVPLAMKQVGGRYGRLINRRHARTGTLWEGRYRACVIDTERYLLTCMRYIELNPVRAGLVKEPQAFRWSSYRANADGADDPLVTPHPILRDLGMTWPERRAAYRALFREALSESALDEIRTATHHGWPLGSRDFAALVGRSTKARAIPRRRRRLASPYVSDT